MKKSVFVLLSLVLLNIFVISFIIAEDGHIPLDWGTVSCCGGTKPLAVTNYNQPCENPEGTPIGCCGDACATGGYCVPSLDGPNIAECGQMSCPSCCSAGSWTWTGVYECSEDNQWIRVGYETRTTNPSGCTSSTRWIDIGQYNYNCPSGQVCTGIGTCCQVATCAEMGLECGSWYDSNCNYPINCDVQRGCSLGQECVQGICNRLRDAQWTDTNGQIITDADEGDTVLMKVEGDELANQMITYTVEESEEPSVWNLWNLFGLIEWSAIMDTDNVGYLELVTTEDDGGKTYRFFAEIVDGVFGEKQSPDLDLYDDDDDDYDDDNDGNTPPIAEIIAPEDEHKTSVGYELDFKQLSEDEDDLLKITWNFGDGDTYVYENYAKGLNPSAADTTHSYSKAGEYTVVLTAAEMERNQKATDRVRVLVFKEGINVVPRITKPAWGVSYGENIVEFDASESFVANCSFDQCEAPAGKTCFEIEGGLNCYYIHEPNTVPGSDLEEYTLLFEWTLTSPGEKEDEVIGFWYDYDDAVEFTHFFSIAGEHRAELVMTYIEI